MLCCALFLQRLNGPNKSWKVHPELVTICDQLSSIVFKLEVVFGDLKFSPMCNSESGCSGSGA